MTDKNYEIYANSNKFYYWRADHFKNKRQKTLLEPQGPQGGALKSLFPLPSAAQPYTRLHCYTTNTELVHRAVCPKFASQLLLALTHYAYPRRDGHAECCPHQPTHRSR